MRIVSGCQSQISAPCPRHYQNHILRNLLHLNLQHRSFITSPSSPEISTPSSTTQSQSAHSSRRCNNVFLAHTSSPLCPCSFSSQAIVHFARRHQILRPQNSPITNAYRLRPYVAMMFNAILRFGDIFVLPSN